MKLSIIVVAYEREHELAEALDSICDQSLLPYEIVVIDNSLSESVSNYITSIKNKIENLGMRLAFERSGQNLGVAGGRNRGIELARGDLLVFLDDDAVFANNDFLERVLTHFKSDPFLGIAAVKSLDYFSGKIRPWELPLRDKSFKDRRQEVSYFIGVSHVIRRKLIEKIGVYNVDSLYGAEELDLSYRLMETDYKIVYFPDLVVRHKKSDKGRDDLIKQLTQMISARTTISFRYFPVWLAVLSTFGYLLLILYSYRTFSPSFVFAIIRIYMKFILGKINRHPLSNNAISRLQLLNGRILY